MPLFSRRVPFNKVTREFGHRSTGVYGHLPKFSGGQLTYVGYLAWVRRKKIHQFWYMGNPYRHKIFETHPNYHNLKHHSQPEYDEKGQWLRTKIWYTDPDEG